MVKTCKFSGYTKRERSGRNKEMLCFFDFTKQVLPALVILIIVQSYGCAAKKDLVKLQLAQNRAVHTALHCNQRAKLKYYACQSLLANNLNKNLYFTDLPSYIKIRLRA